MQIELCPIILALGANLESQYGTPRETLLAIVTKLGPAGIRVIGRSRLYISPPDVPAGAASDTRLTQPDYVNAALAVQSGLSPVELLAALHAIEAELGRKRTIANAARPIDIDIIDYAGRISGGAADGRGRHAPILPHPRAHLRAFVLRPIADICPDWRHPVSGRAVADLIAALPPDAVPARPLI